MDWLWRFLLDTWPLFAAMAMVGLITYGALRPYMKGPGPKQDEETKDD